MSIPRCTLSSVVTSSDCRYIYAIGGFNGIALNAVERYDVIWNCWELRPSLQTARFMLSCALIREN